MKTKKKNSQTGSSKNIQDQLIMIPKVGNSMGTHYYKDEDGCHVAGEYYYVEAVDGKAMSIRLVSNDNTKIKEGKFICFAQADSWGIIFREDIINDSFPEVFTEIEY